MRIEFTHSRGQEYFRAQLRADAWRGVGPTLMLAAMLAVGGAFTALSDADPQATVFGVAALVVAILLTLRARQRFVGAVTVPALWHRPRTWSITEDALESHTDLSSQRWTWAAVQRVEQRPEAYLFWQGPVMFDLPRAPLSTAQESELQAHLVTLGLWRPIAAVTRTAPPATDGA
ncbi:YcxB family protein [Dactylosporangium sp. NPDC049742]|uniref:YcxB family protein n=1 Tax=Dactylosporangium sp. NPDC049742 TaxID=3154737 RepID=UPI003448CA78